MRLWARFIDGLLLMLSFTPAAILMVTWGSRLPAGSVGALAFMPLAVPLALLLYQWFLLAMKGHTLAKKWLGLRVVRRDGEPAGFVRAVLLREWPRLAAYALGVGVLRPHAGTLNNLAACAWIIDAVFVFTKDRRCLHDYLAGTQVDREPEPAQPEG